VIDFGDLCAGDPASDLAAAWMLLPISAIPGFFATYGAAGDAAGLYRRSLGWGALFALMLLEIGLDDKPTYAVVARVTLERLGATVDDGIRPPASRWVDGAVAERATGGLQSLPPRTSRYGALAPQPPLRPHDP